MSDNENSSFTPAVQAVAYMSKNYAPVSTDRTHNVGITNVWQLPFGPGRAHLTEGGGRASLGGWQINNMVSMMTGVPFSVTADDTSLNLPGSTQTADQVKTDVAKLGGTGSATPYYDPVGVCRRDRGALRQQRLRHAARAGLFNWDFGLTREFSLHKDVKLQFKLEAFNFTNTPHLAMPDNFVGDGSDFMTITDVQDLAREGIDERQFRIGFRLVF